VKTCTTKLFQTVLLPSVLVLFLAGACGPEGITGAIEESEFYNTMGLGLSGLFDPDGLAPVAYAVQPFVRVGLMWDAEEGCRLEGRLLFVNGRWSDWYAIEPRWSEGAARTGYLDVPGQGEPTAFQIRHLSGPAPTYLMAEGIGTVGEAAEPQIETPSGLASLGQALAPVNLVHPRSDWGARPPACNSGSHTPAKITIHHTATPLPDSISSTARLRQIQSYHIDTKGWCDIGYHYLVDWNGELWQGRDETVIGAHVANNNTSNVGISFMGTYNSANPTSGQMEHVADLMAWLHDRYGVPLSRSYIKGHREYRGNSPGDCPGDRIYSRLSDLIDMAKSGDPGQQPQDGMLQGVVFVDQGQGTADMSRRLPGATVKLSGGSSTTARDSDAYWSFQLPQGEYAVTVSLAGYQTASRSCTLSSGGETWCSIGMVQDSDPGGDPGQDPGGDPGADQGKISSLVRYPDDMAGVNERARLDMTLKDSPEQDLTVYGCATAGRRPVPMLPLIALLVCLCATRSREKRRLRRRPTV